MEAILNTIENKSKFFAQYWGSPIVYTGKGKPIRGLGKKITLSYENANEFQTILFSNQRAVELKSLSDISDEDAIEVAKLLNWKANDFDIKWIKNKDFEWQTIKLSVTDFLRSRGYALPYMGLSVEKLIEYGWVILA